MFTCMDGVVDNTRQVNSARKVLRLAYKHVLDEVGGEGGEGDEQVLHTSQ